MPKIFLIAEYQRVILSTQLSFGINALFVNFVNITKTGIHAGIFSSAKSRRVNRMMAVFWAFCTARYTTSRNKSTLRHVLCICQEPFSVFSGDVHSKATARRNYPNRTRRTDPLPRTSMPDDFLSRYFDRYGGHRFTYHPGRQ